MCTYLSKNTEYSVCMKSETEGRVTVEPIIQDVVLHCPYPHPFMTHTRDQSENSSSVNLLGKILKVDNTEIDVN